LAYAQQQDDGAIPGRRLPVVQAAAMTDKFECAILQARRRRARDRDRRGDTRPVIICAVCPI